MELKEFVQEVLADVFEGITAAQEELKSKKNTGVINATRSNVMASPVDKQPVANRRAIHQIEIDVAVTVESRSSTKKGGGINVVKVLEARGENTGQSLNSTTSRIKFSVPVAYPH